MAYKFEISKDKAGEFRFRLRAKNGEPILASEGYSAKASAIGASLGAEERLVLEVQQGAHVRVYTQDDVAAPAAVATAGTGTWHELLTAKVHQTISALP